MVTILKMGFGFKFYVLCMLQFILLLIVASTKAQQLGTIHDPDGYTNIRAKPSIQSKVKGRYYDDEVFHIVDADYDTIPQWRLVQSGWNAEKALMGWMHKSRIQALDALPVLLALSPSSEENTITFRNDTIIFSITFQDFDSTQYIIEKDKQGHIISIDGKRPMGTDGTMPGLSIQMVMFQINGTVVDLPENAYHDLFNLNKHTWKCYLNRTGTIMISSSHSDGAGYYQLVWKFKNYQYIGRFLSGT